MYMNISRPVSARFIEATQRSHVRALAAETARQLAYFLRQERAPPAASLPDQSEGSAEGMSAAARLIIMADGMRRGEVDVPVRLQPEVTQLDRDESLRLLLEAARRGAAA